MTCVGSYSSADNSGRIILQSKVGYDLAFSFVPEEATYNDCTGQKISSNGKEAKLNIGLSNSDKKKLSILTQETLGY